MAATLRPARPRPRALTVEILVLEPVVRLEGVWGGQIVEVPEQGQTLRPRRRGRATTGPRSGSKNDDDASSHADEGQVCDLGAGEAETCHVASGLAGGGGRLEEKKDGRGRNAKGLDARGCRPLLSRERHEVRLNKVGGRSCPVDGRAIGVDEPLSSLAAVLHVSEIQDYTIYGAEGIAAPGMAAHACMQQRTLVQPTGLLSSLAIDCLIPRGGGVGLGPETTCLDGPPTMSPFTDWRGAWRITG